jgi:glycosyltransferase involved in cell wall biosynthesis
MSKHVAFIVPYPLGEAPSQRFRFEQYFGILEQQGIAFDVYSFLSNTTWQVLYKPGHYMAKVSGIFAGFLRRILLMFHLGKYDMVFIHREVAPVGPPVFEWIIARLLRKKIIYDFDDAIWLSNTSEHNKIAAAFKWHGKVSAICSWAWKCSCGNDYLAGYARQYCNNVVVNPTTIDTGHLHNRVKYPGHGPLVIGWTGTHSTISYLNQLVPVFEQLEKEHDFKLLVISNREPDFKLKGLQYLPWDKSTEIDDLLKIDVGIMPLEDDKWAAGKCGFKALQYMALGIPAIVSPVGVNTKIVDEGINGYLCSTDQEWSDAIKNILQQREAIAGMSANARKKIIDNYSVLSNTGNFLRLFN